MRKNYIKPHIECNHLKSNNFIAASIGSTITGLSDIDECVHLTGANLGGSSTINDITDTMLKNHFENGGSSLCLRIDACADWGYSSNNGGQGNKGPNNNNNNNDIYALIESYEGIKVEGNDTTLLFKVSFGYTNSNCINN